jgi:cellulose 1,4-beta-cellobiosidase
MKAVNTLKRFAGSIVVLMLVLVSALSVSLSPVKAASVSVCNITDTVNITSSSKMYVVQNNVWNDVNGSNCLSVDDQTGNFTVTSANHNKATNGAPAAYPSIFQGCHWGNCTNNSGMPLQVSAISRATTSWSTTQPGSGTYDVAYDIWFNSTPTTIGQPNGAELMIWLNHQGSIQPVGSVVASNVSLAGTTWNVWEGNSGWNVISYVRTSGTTSVSNLDFLALTRDAVSRGYINTGWYLIDVEAGFEPWVGGAGLGSSGFSVSVAGGGGGPTLTPTRTPTRTNTPFGPTVTPTRTPTPRSGLACSPITATITAPFTRDGTGTFCWQSSNLGSYINSWNLANLTVNGVNLTNVYVSAANLPAKLNGFWYVSYTSSVAWGHFETK